MKKLQLLGLIALLSTAASAVEPKKKINLNDHPKLYSKLYQQLGEEDRVLLFEAQKEHMDEGNIPFDPTVACSRWVGVFVRLRDSDRYTNEIYFDVEDESVFNNPELL